MRTSSAVVLLSSDALSLLLPYFQQGSGINFLHRFCRLVGFYHDVGVLRNLRVRVAQNLLDDLHLTFASCKRVARPRVPALVRRQPQSTSISSCTTASNSKPTHKSGTSQVGLDSSSKSGSNAKRTNQSKSHEDNLWPKRGSAHDSRSPRSSSRSAA
jgi:hypothetical protein